MTDENGAEAREPAGSIAITRHRVWLIGGLIFLALIAGVIGLAIWTAPTRAAVASYVALLNAANRGDIEGARRLCTSRFLERHPLRAAAGGGLVNLPRNLHTNFTVWRQGSDVWLCPTNRVGPIFRFVHEPDCWKFDGTVGVMRARGEIGTTENLNEFAPEAETLPDVE